MGGGRGRGASPARGGGRRRIGPGGRTRGPSGAPDHAHPAGTGLAAAPAGLPGGAGGHRGFVEGIFRITHFSVQEDHLHLIVEADGPGPLSSGAIGLSVRVAAGVNRVLGRRGRVCGDRYHARALTTPREVRNAIVYVLMNVKKHRPPFGLRLDPCSSAPWFDGFEDHSPPAPRRPPGPPAPGSPAKAGANTTAASAPPRPPPTICSPLVCPSAGRRMSESHPPAPPSPQSHAINLVQPLAAGHKRRPRDLTPFRPPHGARRIPALPVSHHLPRPQPPHLRGPRQTGPSRKRAL